MWGKMAYKMTTTWVRIKIIKMGTRGLMDSLTPLKFRTVMNIRMAKEAGSL